MIRQVIHLPAEVSPNVRLALKELCPANPPACYDEWQARLKAGERFRRPSGRTLVPGVLSWADYLLRERTWDAQRKLIGLRARFPDDSVMLLFPDSWLLHSIRLALELDQAGRRRQAKACGVDPAEGGDKTSFVIGDEYGVLECVAKQTPDTTVIIRDLEDLQKRWGFPWERVVFDRACGKAHADRLRMAGRPVQTVHFGESIKLDLKRGLTMIEERREQREVQTVYANRRVEMYHKASHLLDPAGLTGGYGIPARFQALLRQLAPIPHKYDKESGDGKLVLPDKQEMIQTLYNNEGSPDEADAFVLMIFGLTHKSRRATAGAA